MTPTAVLEPHMVDMVFSGSNSSIVWTNQVKPELPAISETPQTTEQDRVSRILREPYGTQRLHHYLEEAIKTRDLDAKTASLAMRVWRTLSALSSNELPVPDAGVGPNGQLLYTWNKDEHHFELEIFPDRHGEFFYLNRRTDEMWDCEYNIGDSVPDEAKEKLREFFLYD
jgi:hypothetical protein